MCLFFHLFVVILLLEIIKQQTSNKNSGKSKEPIRLRQRRTSSGLTDLVLDTYLNDKWSHKYLKMHLVPELTRADKEKTGKRSYWLTLSEKSMLWSSAMGNIASNRSMPPISVSSSSTVPYVKSVLGREQR